MLRARARLPFGFSGGGAPPAAPGPLNQTLPFFEGIAVDETTLGLNVGEWTGTVTGFDVEVVTVEATPVVLLARQSVDNTTSGSLTGTAGKDLKLRVWAKNGTSETLAESAVFGTMAAMTDQFVLATFWSASTTPAMIETPYPYTTFEGLNTKTALTRHGPTQLAATGAYPIANPNAGMAGLSFGFAGTTDLGAGSSTSTGPTTDMRRRGRLNANSALSAHHLRIDLPGAGTYLIYAGAGHTSVVSTVNFGVWRIPTANSGVVGIISAYQRGATNVPGGQVMDAAGNVTDVATWAAGAVMGMGVPVEITVSAAESILIGRSDTNPGATQLNCVAVFKKAP